MKIYRISSNYKIDPSYILRNDINKMWADYKRDGYYFKRFLEYIPISKIRYESWDRGRYQRAYEAIKAGRKLDPVVLHLGEDGWYEVSDGNHRITASKDLGYTHVPAEITRRIDGPPEGKPDMAEVNKEIFSDGILMYLQVLKKKTYSLGLDFVWSATNVDSATILVSHTGVWEESPLTISYVDNPYDVNMDLVWEGRVFSFSGSVKEGFDALFSFFNQTKNSKESFKVYEKVVLAEGGFEYKEVYPDGEEDTWEEVGQAEQVFKDEEIRPNSQKDVSDVVLEDGTVIGATSSGWDAFGEKALFSFDIAIKKEYQGMKIGTQLIARAIRKFESERDVYEEMGQKTAMELEAINLKLADFIVREFGFVVVKKLPDRVILYRE